MEYLKQVIVESEAAHFRANPAPKLKLIQENENVLDFQEFESHLQSMLKRFLRILQTHQEFKLERPEAFGFQFLKCLLQEQAEYVLERKRQQQRLHSDQVRRLNNLLSSNATLAYFRQGAQLGLILEQEEPLPDSELFYLCETERPPLAGTLRDSFFERTAMRLLQEQENKLAKFKSDRKKKALGIVSSFLLPLYWLTQI